MLTHFSKFLGETGFLLIRTVRGDLFDPESYDRSRGSRISSRGGHSYSTRRTVRDRGQDAVKRSSRIFSTGQAVKRTFWVGQRSRPNFAQTNSYSNSYPTGYTHDFVYTVYLSRLTSQLPAHALGLTFHSFWNRKPSFIMYGL